MTTAADAKKIERTLAALKNLGWEWRPSIDGKFELIPGADKRKRFGFAEPTSAIDGAHFYVNSLEEAYAWVLGFEECVVVMSRLK